MAAAKSSANAGAAATYGVSAGLDLLSGVFGYLSSLNNASAASSRAELMRTEAEANAQRYSEKAQQFEAQQKMMFLASGVTLKGSPVDVLATTARLASENIAAIRMGGDIRALDQEQTGINAESQGRNALLGSAREGLGFGLKAYGAATGAGAKDTKTSLGALIDILGGKS